VSRAVVRRTVLAVGLLSAGVGAASAQGTGGFAVLPFEDTGSYGQDKEVFDGLELGLGDMLGRALEQRQAAQVVPSARVRQSLAAERPGRRIDAATAAKVGQAVGARWAITGTFADFYGKFRLSARLVDTRNGQIVQVVSNDDPKHQDRAALDAIVQQVADRLASAAGLPGGPAATGPAIPTDAITFYGRGLLHESRGDAAGAAGYYRQALTSFPQFEDARTGLDRTQGR
jgi:TolB-like protein